MNQIYNPQTIEDHEFLFTHLCDCGEAGGQGGELPALAASGLGLRLEDDGLQADGVGGGGGEAGHGVVRGAGVVTVRHQLRELGGRGLELADSYPEDTVNIIMVMSASLT